MCVRLRLALGIHARTVLPDEARGRAETAVGLDGIRLQAAPAVVRREHHRARRVHTDVTRSRRLCGDLVQQREMSRCRIHRERTHRPGLFAVKLVHLVCGIEHGLPRVRRQKCRARRLGRQHRRRQGAVRVHPRDIDSLARFPGEGPDISPVVFAGGRMPTRCEAPRTDQKQSHRTPDPPRFQHAPTQHERTGIRQAQDRRRAKATIRSEAMPSTVYP